MPIPNFDPPDQPGKKKKQKPPVLNYIGPSEKHIAFHKAWQTHVRMLCGAYGSGKTRSACADILLNLLYNPKYFGKTALVVGQTHHHVKNQLYEQHFKQILTHKNKRGNDIGLIEGVHYTIEWSPQIKVKFYNGSIILFASWEAKKNLAGFSVSMVFADEVDKAPDEETWNLIQSRVRGESDYGMVIATCNPDVKSHWLYGRYFQKVWEDHTLIEGFWTTDGPLTMYDNSFLSARDWKNAEERFNYSPLVFQQAIMGEWISKEGAVYSNFDRRLHTFTYDKEGRNTRTNIGLDWTIMCGLDFGGGGSGSHDGRIAVIPGQGDPTACIWVAQRPPDHEGGKPSYIVFREHYENTLTISQRAKHFLKPWGSRMPSKFITDNYTETFLSYKEAGVPVQKADKSRGSLSQGIELIQQLLFENRLMIDDRCKNLIREFETYQYKKNSNVPEDKHNHAVDSLRYVITEFEGKGAFFVSAPMDDGSHFYEPEEFATISVSTGKNLGSDGGVPEGCILFGYDPFGKPQYVRIA